MLVLKVTKDRVTYGGTIPFTYPEAGSVECPDWDPTPKCGNGLHGWAGGEGNYIHEYMDGTWLVIDVDEADVVRLDGGDKVKFRRGNVIYCGAREGAVALLIERGAFTAEAQPGWCCFTPDQSRILAQSSSDRANGHAAAARYAADAAVRAARYAADAARAAAVATAYADARAAAVAARAAADAAVRAARYAAAAAAADAATAYADAAAAAAAERESHIRDRRALLGLLG